MLTATLGVLTYKLEKYLPRATAAMLMAGSARMRHRGRGVRRRQPAWLLALPPSAAGRPTQFLLPKRNLPPRYKLLPVAEFATESDHPYNTPSVHGLMQIAHHSAWLKLLSRHGGRGRYLRARRSWDGVQNVRQ